MNYSPACDVYVYPNAIVELYFSDSENPRKDHLSCNCCGVDVSYAKLRRQNTKGRIQHKKGDEVLWKYHEYDTDDYYWTENVQ